MPHKPCDCEELLQSGDCLSVGVMPRRKKPISRMKRPKPSPLTTEIAQTPKSADAFMRTGLLMAALRVWELKNGIHDYF